MVAALHSESGVALLMTVDEDNSILFPSDLNIICSICQAHIETVVGFKPGIFLLF